MGVSKRMLEKLKIKWNGKKRKERSDLGKKHNMTGSEPKKEVVDIVKKMAEPQEDILSQLSEYLNINAK